MRFEERRHVRRQHRDRVARSDAAAPQRIGKAPAALVELAVGKVPIAVHDRQLVGIDCGRAREEAERRQCRAIRRIAREMRCIVDPFHAAILGRRTGSVKRRSARTAGVPPACGRDGRGPNSPVRHEIDPEHQLGLAIGGGAGADQLAAIAEDDPARGLVVVVAGDLDAP